MTLEEGKIAIRQSLPVSKVASRYTRLRPGGRGELKGLCPFPGHAERTPSFTVDDEKGLCYCFGCKRGGDVFKLVMEVEGVGFGEALHMLAQEAGVHLPEKREDGPSLRENLELAQRAYLEQIALAPRVREYLEARGVAPETQQRYALGYAPPAPLLSGLLDPEAAERLGLRNREGRLDFLRHRLVIPIQDSQGRPIAFTGRALARGQEPKYLNTPENPLFKKSRTLFGLPQAKALIRERGYAVVVEGPLDAMTLVQRGEPAVAVLGSSLTDEQAHTLTRTGAEYVYLAFDRDPAGLKAFLDSIRALRGYGNLRCVVWPRKDANASPPEESVRAVADSLSPAQFLLRVAERQCPDTASRLRWLEPWLKPASNADAIPHELAERLREQGLVVAPGQAPVAREKGREAEAEAERGRLLEADIAAVLFSVRDPAERLRLLEFCRYEVLPEPGSLLAPVFDALQSADPLGHLTRLGAGDVFYRRIMEAPPYAPEEARRRLAELAYRLNVHALERLVEQAREAVRHGDEGALVSYDENLKALEALRRARYAQ